MGLFDFRIVNINFWESRQKSLYKRKLKSFLCATRNSDMNVLIFLLKDSRGDRAIFSENIGGNLQGFELIEDLELNEYVKTFRQQGYNIVVGFTPASLDFLIISNHRFNIMLLPYTLKPRKKCLLCGNNIPDGNFFICNSHEKKFFQDTNLRSCRNSNMVMVNKGASNKFTYGVEFEISSLSNDENIRSEFATVVIENKWIITPDSTVYSELKSPIYYGSLPFHWESFSIFDLFDHCIDNNILSVGSNAGTHLHIATADESSVFKNNGAIRNFLSSNPDKLYNVWIFIRSIEAIIDSKHEIVSKFVFGRIFQNHAHRTKSDLDLLNKDSLSSLLLENRHWINFQQHDGLGKTIEFRLNKYINSKQYNNAFIISKFMFKMLLEIMGNNISPLKAAMKFETKLNGLVKDFEYGV